MKTQLKGFKEMNKIFKISLVAVSLLIISCEIPADLNDNPNEITVSDVDANLFLNGAQLANVIVQVSHLNRISGMFSGQLVGYASLYSNIYGYSLSTVESNDEWSSAYVGVVANTRHIQASAPDDKLLVGITQVLEAHAMSTLAILTGDVPFSEVLSEKDAPKFDDQKAVLDGCSALLSSAITSLSEATSRSEAYDIYYGGDKDKWIAAAYTLKARLALIEKDYAAALSYAGTGISSSSGDMMYIPRGDAATPNGDKNLYWEILNGSRTGDLGNAKDGNRSYLIDILDPAHANYRGNAKTNEQARYGYYSIDENSSSGNTGVVEQFEPQPMVTYTENQLIKAEASARTAGFASGLSALNAYRSWLAGGGRLNAAHNDVTKYKYDAYLEADFTNGGIENSDGLTKDQALLREIVEERYVSGFGTYMPFNDHRRLRGAGETNLIPSFPLNTPTATKHVERLPWAQDELTSNSTVSEDPGLYSKTAVNR
jgi:hypothetical protein|tara:strand:- start:884 stop:2341 length:1458 start_codon:yes stop_codon:yes gene_type:complete